MSILVLSGSPSRRPSRSAALLDHVVGRLREASVVVETLGVHDLPTDDLIRVRWDGEAATALRARVAHSRAVVIGTPIYNASIPGGLKALLDLLPERALHGKPVLALASGGSAGHQLAIEYSLKPVLSSLGARHVLGGVFAADADVQWSGESAMNLPIFAPALIGRLDEAVDALLAVLATQEHIAQTQYAAWRPVPAIRVGDVAVPDPTPVFPRERCRA